LSREEPETTIKIFKGRNEAGEIARARLNVIEVIDDARFRARAADDEGEEGGLTCVTLFSLCPHRHCAKGQPNGNIEAKQYFMGGKRENMPEVRGRCAASWPMALYVPGQRQFCARVWSFKMGYSYDRLAHASREIKLRAVQNLNAQIPITIGKSDLRAHPYLGRA
jgi:hypothetical protein